MTEFAEHGGYLWPIYDGQAHGVVVDSLADLDRVVKRCRNTRGVVQAGGNVGVWAKHLSKTFDAVYTFEPDHDNFACLARNATETNIIKLQGVLGNTGDPVSIAREPHNCGANYIGEQKGIVPVLRIDDLHMQHCDLIYLDVEGYELQAIHGAQRTIREHRPLIAFEDKGLSERYGIKIGELQAWLRDVFNYRVVDNIANDVVCECSL